MSSENYKDSTNFDLTEPYSEGREGAKGNTSLTDPDMTVPLFDDFHHRSTIESLRNQDSMKTGSVKETYFRNETDALTQRIFDGLRDLKRQNYLSITKSTGDDDPYMLTEDILRVSDAKKTAEVATKEAQILSEATIQKNLELVQQLSKRFYDVLHHQKPKLDHRREELNHEKESFKKSVEQFDHEYTILSQKLSELQVLEDRILHEKEEVDKELYRLNEEEEDLDSEKLELERTLQNLQSSILQRQNEMQQEMRIRCETEIAIKSSENEVTIHSLKNKLEKYKAFDLASTKIRTEIDERVQKLQETLQSHQQEIRLLNQKKHELSKQMEKDNKYFHNELTEKTEILYESHKIEVDKRLVDIKSDEGLNMQGEIQSLQNKLMELKRTKELSCRSLSEYERCYENYKTYVNKLKQKRFVLFEEIEQHIFDWQSYYESNIKSICTQFEQVIHTNIIQWRKLIRNDTTAQVIITSTEGYLMNVFHELNNISKLKSTKVEYPKFETEIKRDIDINFEDTVGLTTTLTTTWDVNWPSLPYVPVPPLVPPQYRSFEAEFPATHFAVSPKKSPRRHTIVKLNRVYSPTKTLPMGVSYDYVHIQKQQAAAEAYQNNNKPRARSASGRRPVPQSRDGDYVTRFRSTVATRQTMLGW